MDKIEILNFISCRPPKVALFLLGFLLIFVQFGQMRKVSLDGCSFPHSLFFFFFLIIPTKQGNVMLTQFPFSSLLFLSAQTTQLCFSTCLSSPLSTKWQKYSVSLSLFFSLFPRIPNTIYTHTYIHIYIYIYILLKSSINVDFNIELHINYLKHMKTFNSNNLLV